IHSMQFDEQARTPLLSDAMTLYNLLGMGANKFNFKNYAQSSWYPNNPLEYEAYGLMSGGEDVKSSF
ncbi:MAG: hypothetical protein KKC05_02635, partial [Nanoarchaeota archaeon]|nr:hypothetical protein [Nanoarchaeota archaeon]